MEDGVGGEDALEDGLAEFSAADLAEFESLAEDGAAEEAFSLDDAFEDGLVDLSLAGDAFEGLKDSLDEGLDFIRF
ncbi:hypothetical protein H9P43_002312 [Blastocladiella emersonii ATCC 22665]|nr:hypothetical protein H9P43_002312 [Blastocladiella emersonii ATCC 22665]